MWYNIHEVIKGGDRGNGLGSSLTSFIDCRNDRFLCWGRLFLRYCNNSEDNNGEQIQKCDNFYYCHVVTPYFYLGGRAVPPLITLILYHRLSYLSITFFGFSDIFLIIFAAAEMQRKRASRGDFPRPFFISSMQKGKRGHGARIRTRRRCRASSDPDSKKAPAPRLDGRKPPSRPVSCALRPLRARVYIVARARLYK